MAAVTAHFPALDLTLDDVIATFAGIRPVIGSGKADPSDESRDHVIWQENGLLTVTGGKLTTFRQIARQALERVCEVLDDPRGDEGKSRLAQLHDDAPVLNPIAELPTDQYMALPEEARRRLLGRYGGDAAGAIAAARPGELEAIPGAIALWAELRWSARAEAVAHLEDLLLRRVRLGLLLPRGGADHLPRIRAIVQPELGWDDARWAAEEAAYLSLIANAYGLPDRETIPDWRAMLAQSRADRAATELIRRERRVSLSRRAGIVLLLAALLLILIHFWRRGRRPEDANG
jgi:glycerol-3-phosphate dehydrogenase